MRHPSSPLRQLAKSYANELVTREQYIEIRAQLLKRLESIGNINELDLNKYMARIKSPGPRSPRRSYTSSDWIIIALGLLASAVLAFVLYS